MNWLGGVQFLLFQTLYLIILFKKADCVSTTQNGTYGKYCDAITYFCLPGLVCKEGRCDCEYDDLQYNEWPSPLCTSVVGGPCSLRGDKDTQACTKNAECVQNDKSAQCSCKNGFVEVSRNCEIEYGGNCSVDGGIICDSFAPLKCIDQICQCKRLEYYDNRQRKCRGLVGALCNKTLTDFCTNGAYCQSYRNTSEIWGLCNCPKFCDETDDHRCDCSRATSEEERLGIKYVKHPTVDNVSAALLPVGFDFNGDILYSCRFHLEGNIFPGTYTLIDRTCRIAHNLKEHRRNDTQLEVLTNSTGANFKWVSTNNPSVNACPGGRTREGHYVYVVRCQLYKDGKMMLLPGKFEPNSGA